MGGVYRDKWDDYIRNIFRILKPGNGWAQCGETSLPQWDDDSVPPDSQYAKVVSFRF